MILMRLELILTFRFLLGGFEFAGLVCLAFFLNLLDVVLVVGHAWFFLSFHLVHRSAHRCIYTVMCLFE